MSKKNFSRKHPFFSEFKSNRRSNHLVFQKYVSNAVKVMDDSFNAGKVTDYSSFKKIYLLHVTPLHPSPAYSLFKVGPRVIIKEKVFSMCYLVKQRLNQ